MDVLKTAILEMCRQKKNEAFCPSEVVKWLFPEDWEQFIEEVNSTALELNREGLIQISRIGNDIKTGSSTNGPIRIISHNSNHSKR